jgi:hypothetical protein
LGDDGLGEATGYYRDWVLQGCLSSSCWVRSYLQSGPEDAKENFEPEAISRNGARLVSKARYRGRRVFHYSDGEVIAETKRGFRPFESFDAYRYYVDRR